MKLNKLITISSIALLGAGLAGCAGDNQKSNKSDDGSAHVAYHANTDVVTTHAVTDEGHAVAHAGAAR